MASSVGDESPKSIVSTAEEHVEDHENHSNGKIEDGKDENSKHTFSIGASVAHPGDDFPVGPVGPRSPAEGPRQYRAAPFNAPDEAESKAGPTLALPDTREFQRYVRQTEVNWLGCIVFFVYLCSFVFYLWIRCAKTLNLGPYVAYGYYVLAVEIMGASTVILYGVNLLWNPVLTPYMEDPENPGLTVVNHPYHVRVLVPCYSESLDILRRTVMAAYDAVLPEECMITELICCNVKGCTRTIYLCDDGKDPKKRKWVDSLGADVVYVSGRKRPPGEMNGKSGNINNCASQIYPRGTAVPGNELICVFDADQVASREFFLKTLPLFDGGDDVGMVLSPQCFHNLNLHSDIFNHSNVHFWEYMQPGYDALGFISCTGTNFLVRSNALLEAGGSPTWTLTEDFALGMELKKYGWHCRYVQEYLAIGEAPDQIRNCYQQRSRWCKGHFQIMFNKTHCPLTQQRLSFFMKVLYCSGVWSYVVGAISTPTFILIPIITIWFGVFPIVVSFWAALGITVYAITTHSVLYYVRSHKHIEALWFANTANALLWWTYVKAFWRALNSVFGEKIQFKTTLKGASLLMNTAFRDLWMPGLCFLLLMASVGEGLYQLFTTASVTSPLAMSVIWAIYNAVPPALVLFYALVGKGALLQYLCRFCLLLSFFCGATAVGLIWGLYPRDYNFGQVINQVNFFYNAQKVGTLPAAVTNEVSWIQSSLSQEATAGPAGRDVSGGWVTGGDAFSTKATIPTAFTVSLMAWSLISFPHGFSAAGATAATLSNIRWGTDYLLKTVDNGVANADVVYQVGNLTIDSQNWEQPWEITYARPSYALKQSAAGSDLQGPIIAALAASAIAITEQADPTYYNTLMSAAQLVYKSASANLPGVPLYSSALGSPICADYTDLGASSPTSNCTSFDRNGSTIPIFDTTTKYDVMSWAAVWMYKATGDPNYLTDAEDWYQIHLYSAESQNDVSVLYNWSSYFWALNVLLAQTTNDNTFHEATQGFLQKWVCAINGVVQYTPRGRAYNPKAPTLGDTANVAFLAATYAHSVGSQFSKQASRYWCWARTQTRYMLGDAGRSFVVGQGADPPTHAQNPAASCPPAPATCNYINNFLSSTPNTNILYGALVEGAGFSDNFVDVRSQNDTRVPIHNNAGFLGVLASMQDAPGTWEQCLQGYGILTQANSIC